MVKEYFLIGLFAFALFIFSAETVSACVCSINDKNSLRQDVLKSLKYTDAIFSGKVLAVEFRQMSDEEAKEEAKKNLSFRGFFSPEYKFEILTVKIEVYRWWKGFKTKEITLLTETYRKSNGTNSTTSCERGFKVGEELLLFTKGENQAKLKNLPCSFTNFLNKSGEVISILGSGYAPKKS